MNNPIIKTKAFSKENVEYRLTVSISLSDFLYKGHDVFSLNATMKYKALGITHWNDCHNNIDNALIEHFPDLEKFMKWRLCSALGPVYYTLALNYAGYSPFKNEKILKDLVIYGALKEDHCVNPVNLNKKDLNLWLAQRLPHLINDFNKDIQSLGLTTQEVMK